MKTCTLIRLATAGVALTLGGCAVAPAPAEAPAGLELQAVINEVKDVLGHTQDALAFRGMPPLKDVKLTLQTTATRKGGGSLRLWVVTAGATMERDATQEIVLTLVPPAAHRALAAGPDLAGELEGAILGAAEGVEKAKDGPVPLVVNALEVEISFVVRRTASGGVGFELAPATIAASGDASRAVTQTIRLDFAAR